MIPAGGLNKLFEIGYCTSLTHGLPAVEAACAEALSHGVHSADVVFNILARQRDSGPQATILAPAALTLRHAPISTVVSSCLGEG